MIWTNWEAVVPIEKEADCIQFPALIDIPIPAQGGQGAWASHLQPRGNAGYENTAKKSPSVQSGLRKLVSILQAPPTLSPHQCPAEQIQSNCGKASPTAENPFML